MRARILFAILILLTFNTQAQKYEDVMGYPAPIHKGNFTISAGYGAPSIVRAFLRNETKEEDLQIEGFGPLCAKVDYMLFKNFSIGINAFYNYTDASWLDDGRADYDVTLWTKVRYGVRVNELSFNLKLNYHYYVRKNIDMYAGIGAGYGSIDAETYAETRYPAFFLKHKFPEPLSFEATTGLRYFLHKNFGVFTEVGIGRSWVLYRKYFLPEAVIQGGIFLKL